MTGPENSKEFYEKEANIYDKKRWLTPAGKLVNAVQLEIFQILAGRFKNLKILEIAAGTGRFTKVLLEQDNPVTAIDASISMLEQLKQSLKEHPNYKYLQIIVGDARNIELEPSSVDVAVCLNALSHISNHKRVLSEVYRVLKPSGIFLFNIPNYLSLYLPFGLYVNLRKKSVTRDVYTKWYSFKKFSKDLMNVGFEIVDIKGQLHIPIWTPSFLLPLLKIIDKNFRDGKIAIFAPVLYIKAQKIDSIAK